MIATLTNVITSPGGTPKAKGKNAFDSVHAATHPTVVPSATNLSAKPMTSPRTEDRLAPNASFTPIALICCPTRNAIVPYIPMALRTIATNPRTPIIPALNLRPSVILLKKTFTNFGAPGSLPLRNGLIATRTAAETALDERRGTYQAPGALRWAPLLAAPITAAAHAARAIAPGQTTRILAQVANGLAVGVGAVGLATSIFYPVTFSLVTRDTPTGRIGAKLGIYNTLFGSGWTAGPVVAGISSDAFGSGSPYLAFAVAGSALAGSIAIVKRK